MLALSVIANIAGTYGDTRALELYSRDPEIEAIRLDTYNEQFFHYGFEGGWAGSIYDYKYAFHLDYFQKTLELSNADYTRLASGAIVMDRLGIVTSGYDIDTIMVDGSLFDNLTREQAATVIMRIVNTASLIRDAQIPLHQIREYTRRSDHCGHFGHSAGRG